MRVDEVDVVAGGEETVDGGVGVVAVPVADNGSHEISAVGLEGADKACVAVFCGGGAGQAVDFYCVGAAAEQVARIAGGGAPQGLVVYADVGGVSGGVDIAVENHHGHTGGVYFLDNGSEGSGLVGGDEDDVEVVVDKIADVGNLFVVVVVGGAYLNHGVMMEHYLAVDFVVHFFAPVVLAALRDSDFVYFVVGAALQHQHQGQEDICCCSIHGFLVKVVQRY